MALLRTEPDLDTPQFPTPHVTEPVDPTITISQDPKCVSYTDRAQLITTPQSKIYLTFIQVLVVLFFIGCY